MGLSAAQFDPVIYQTVGTIIQDFEDVCFAVYKAATDNPDKEVSKQDVDWPADFRSVTDRKSKRVENILIDIDIDFEASDKKVTTTTEWGGSQMVDRSEVFDIPSIHCSFSLSSETDWEPFRLSTYVYNSWWGRKKYISLESSATQYAMEQINHDCDTGKVRLPKIYHAVNKNGISLHYNFPKNPIHPASELRACSIKSQNFNNGFGGGFRIMADGSVVGPDGAQIGRVKGDGNIVNNAGKIIGHFSDAQFSEAMSPKNR